MDAAQENGSKATKARKPRATKPKAAAAGKRATKKSENTVKRPRSAYLCFLTATRPQIAAENPNATFAELSRILSEKWSKMSDSDKAPYQKEADEDKARYQRELAAGGKTAPIKRKSTKKASKSPKSSSGGMYFDLAKEAIVNLKSRKGSSQAAIEKYIVANHPDLNFQRHFLRNTLKKHVEAGDLVKNKASFKLAKK